MNYSNNHDSYNTSLNTVVLGNSITVDTNCDASEIKADVKVVEYDSLRLWGQILTCDEKPVANTLIKLVKIVECDGHKIYEGVAHTISDCNGFYQFELCKEDRNKKFKVLVSKSATGQELVRKNSDGDCNSCHAPTPCSKECKPKRCSCCCDNRAEIKF